MILTEKMLSLAFDVREVQPWKLIDDSCLFAVKLSSGEIGYICVMGNAGEHFGIGLYIGQKGFSSYLKSIHSTEDSRVELAERLMSFDYLCCNFENAVEISSENKKLIRAHVETYDRKIRRSKGWPVFLRYSPYKAISSITEEADVLAMVEALQAVLAMARKLNETDDETLGFDPNRKYPTIKGGKKVPLLTPNTNGSFDFGMTELPAQIKDEFKPTPFLNDILVHAVSMLPQGERISCKYYHLPLTNGDQLGEVPSLIPVILCVSQETGMIYPIMPSEGTICDENHLLAHLANTFISKKQRPMEIFVSEKRTQAMFHDFCKRCGIKLCFLPHNPQLDEAIDELYWQMSTLL